MISEKSQHFILSILSLIWAIVLVIGGDPLVETFASSGTVFANMGNIIIKISTWLATLSSVCSFLSYLLAR